MIAAPAMLIGVMVLIDTASERPTRFVAMSR